MSFFSFLIKNKFPNREQRSALFQGPLTISRLVFYILFIGFLIVVYIGIIKLNDSILVTVPARGGNLTEGIIGSPRFINPVLAATETDMALTHLIYAGLMKEYGDGTIAPELASKYDISPDGRIYTFTLRDKQTFHDNSTLTSSDVAFTIEKLQDSALNPRQAMYWQDITVSTPNKQTVIFNLVAPNNSFLRHTTVGIMSATQWQGVENTAFIDPSLNLSPIGAGSFKVDSLSTNQDGAVQELQLSRNRRYTLSAPLLDSLIIKVYPNQESLFLALKNGSIDFTMDLLPQSLPEGSVPKEISISSIPTTNTIELFRRRGEPTLSNPSFLALINQYIDKQSIVATVENSYGIPFETKKGTSKEENGSTSLVETQEALSKLGYTLKQGVLSKGGTNVVMAIATLNTPELIATGRLLSQQLTALGIISEVQAFDIGTFQDEVAVAGFPLVLIDKTVKLPTDYETGIPLYTTAHLASIGPHAYGIEQVILNKPELRYANVDNWHTYTDRIWKGFKKDKNKNN